MYDKLPYREDVVPYRVELVKALPQPGTIDQSVREMFVLCPGFTRLKEHLLSDDSRPHTVWKPCEHYKCSQVTGSGDMSVNGTVDHLDNAQLHSLTIPTPDALYSNEFGTAGEYNSYLPAYYEPRDDAGFVPPPSELESLQVLALKRILPILKSELSLLNTLIEIKDIVTLRSTVENVARTLRNVIFRKGVPLRSLFRTKADVYLQYKFNIAPLLSDITGIYRSLANSEKRINDLIARSGRVRVSHFSKTLTESADTDPMTAVSGGYLASDAPSNTGSYHIRTVVNRSRFVVTDPASFHVQVQFNYNYAGYQAEHAQLLSILDAMGVNLNPQIIWNAIPWSFVVDWVLGVGQYLSRFKVGNMDPKINILQCLWSIKRRRRITVTGYTTSQQYYGGPIDTLQSHFTHPVVEESAYRRSLFYPTRGSIESSGLTPTEYSLGAALVLSQRRRPKRLRR